MRTREEIEESFNNEQERIEWTGDIQNWSDYYEGWVEALKWVLDDTEGEN